LGEEQIAEQHAAKGVLRVVIGVPQVQAHHAVVDLAAFAAPLPLDPGRLVALLARARGIQHAHRLPRAVLVGHQANQLLGGTILVPAKERQELLQGANRHPGGQGNRLNRLAFDIRQQAQDVLLQVREGLVASETIAKLPQQLRQRRSCRSEAMCSGVISRFSKMSALRRIIGSPPQKS